MLSLVRSLRRQGLDRARCLSTVHPWLAQLPSSTLRTEERIFTFLAANTAAGKVDYIEQDWKFLTRHQHLYSSYFLDISPSHSGGLEAVIQTHLFAGFPRTLNALAAIHRVGVNVQELPREMRDESRLKWRRQGEDLCSEVYGSSYMKLRSKTKELHPDFDSWMIETGYGRVMSRLGLTRRMRELCVIAALMGQNVPPQLVSHIRGAIRCGATKEEVESVLSEGYRSWGESVRDSAMRVYHAMDTTRYTL